MLLFPCNTEKIGNIPNHNFCCNQSSTNLSFKNLHFCIRDLTELFFFVFFFLHNEDKEDYFQKVQFFPLYEETLEFIPYKYWTEEGKNLEIGVYQGIQCLVFLVLYQMASLSGDRISFPSCTAQKSYLVT